MEFPTWPQVIKTALDIWADLEPIRQKCRCTCSDPTRPYARMKIVKHYKVVIHQEPEGGYWGEVPALPGCYSQGETVAELLENIREAISGVMEVMAEQGQKPEENIQILDIAV